MFEDLSKLAVALSKRRAIIEDQLVIMETASNFRAFFEDDFEAIKDIIYNELIEKTFSKATLDKIRIQHLNIIRKPLNRKISGIYDSEPKRYLKFDDEEQVQEDGTIKKLESQKSKDQNSLLMDVLDKFDFSNKVKAALKVSEFFNIALVMPVYREDSPERLQYSLDVLLPDEYVPITGKDFLVLEKIMINRLNDEKNMYWLVFTDEENYIVDSLGNKKVIEGRKEDDFENVYGIIPISILRKNIGGDFYGQPNWNLYNSQLEADIALTDMRHSETYQHFGVYWGINTNLGTDTVFSPNTFIDLKVSDPTLPRPELNVLVPGVDFKALRDNVDWRIDKAQNLEGIPSASTSTDTNNLSGYSKEIDEGELNEMRELARATLWRFEIDLLNLIAIVWNYHNPGKRLDNKTGKFTVEFSEEKPHENISDKTSRRKMEAEYKINTPIDFIMEDKEVSREEAEEIYNANKTFYDKLGTKPLTAIERILNGGNGAESGKL